ncbi:unnamed protein product [Mucor fragilis]
MSFWVLCLMKQAIAPDMTIGRIVYPSAPSLVVELPEGAPPELELPLELLLELPLELLCSSDPVELLPLLLLPPPPLDPLAATKTARYKIANK